MMSLRHLLLALSVATLLTDAAKATSPTSSTSSPYSTSSISSTASPSPSTLSTNLPSDALSLDVDGTEPPLCECLEKVDDTKPNVLRCSFGRDEEAGSAALTDLLASKCAYDSVDIFNVDLTYVAVDAFVATPDLVIVYLHSDYIQHIDAEAFRGLTALTEVDLSDNSLLSVDPKTFASNPQLQSVSLSDNPLVDLKPNTPILESESITSLDLSFCKLKTLTKESFAKLPNLQRVDLSNNDIQYLPMSALQSVSSLNALNIGNNRWSCDCAFKEVMEFAQTMEATDTRVRCYAPDRTMQYWSEKSAAKYCAKPEAASLVIESNVEDQASGMAKGDDDYDNSSSAEYDENVDLPLMPSFDDLKQDTSDLRQAMHQLVSDDAVTVVDEDVIIVLEGTDVDADADAYVVPTAVLVFVLAALIVFCIGVAVAVCRGLVRRGPGQGWAEMDEEGDGDSVYKRLPRK